MEWTLTPNAYFSIKTMFKKEKWLFSSKLGAPTPFFLHLNAVMAERERCELGVIRSETQWRERFQIDVTRLKVQLDVNL